MAQVDAMDAWREEQGDPRLTRADALEYFVAKGLGMELPTFSGRKRPPTEAERDERAEYYCQLRAELGSYAAVARKVGYTTETIRQVIANYERRQRLSILKAQNAGEAVV